MSVLAKLAAAAAVVFLLPVVIIVLAVGGVASVFSSSGSGQGVCAPVGASATSAAGYGPEQMGNAATIVAVGKQMQVSEYGWVIAVAAAMQESGLRNLPYGDRDSLGLFQQRPSQGWGTPQQILTPTYAATQFYQHLLALPNWQQLGVSEAAQAVQRSGFPGRYANHERGARQIVGALTGVSCATTAGAGTGDCNNIQAPTPAAMTAINYACGQRGVPYLWGGNGVQDGGFDCSGLTKAAYDAAGISLPRTAQTQYAAGPRVPAGQPLLPGDLVFYGAPSKIHHVGLFIGNGQMVHASTWGQPVKIAPYRNDKGDDYLGATRPSH
ncbi:C40 family peptidase [Amycolatopsis sp. NPDC059657]|uniref:C40 family peptidase n=1 Tax=Amycolatopsis sp. NPDC059657 TaxID=3346899 RepID=UPI00366D0584